MVARLLLLVVSICLLVAWRGGTKTDYTVHVTVKTLSGDLVPGATVQVVSDAGITISAVTNGSGTATFYLQRGGEVHVKALDHDFGEAAQDALLLDSNPTISMTLTLKKGDAKSTYHFSVTVVSEAGDAIPGALVQISGPASASATANSAGTASFEVPHRGEYSIAVIAENFAVGNDTVTLSSTDDAPSITVVLGRAIKHILTLNVRVIDEDGRPIEGAKLVMTGLPTKAEVTDSQGEATFRVTNWETSKAGAMVTVSHLYFRSESFGIDMPPTGGQDVTLAKSVVLKRSVHDGVVIIHVMEQGTRQPLEGASIRMVGSKPEDTPLGPRPAVITGTTKGSGECLIYGSPNHYTVTASHTGYGSGSTEVDLGDRGTQEVTIELTPKASRTMARMLRVHVVGATAQGKTVPLEDATVSTSFGGSGTTNASGDDYWLHEEAPGETINVTATPHDRRFKKASNSVIVNARGSLFDAGKRAGWEQLGFTDAEVEHFAGVVERTHHAEMSAKLYSAYNSLSGAHGIDSVTITCPEQSGEALHGDLVVDHGRVDVGEIVKLDFALLYEHGNHEKVDVSDKVVLYGPSGAVITSDAKQRTLKNDEFSRRSLEFTPKEPGTYTVRATASGSGVAAWHDEVKFSASPATAGWVLVQKRVRKPAGDEVSTSEKSYVTTGYTITYSDPPPVMEVGKTYVFTTTSTGTTYTGRWNCPIAEDNPGIHAHYSVVRYGTQNNEFTVKIEAPPRKDPTPTGRTLLTMFTIGRGEPIGEFVYEWRSK